MKFESELKKGVFIIGKCPKCKKTTWPPNDFCNICFEELEWQESSYQGKLIEFAKKNNECFCVAEIDEGVRIIGTLIMNSKKPKIGSKIKLKKCEVTNENYSFIMTLI